MAQQTPKFHPGRRHLLLLAVAAVAVYVLLPQIGDFRSSWQLLRRPEAWPVIGAVVLTFASYAAAAGTYCLLAFKPLPYARTVLVQLAAMFVNRLLPAGLGALGANYLYLRRQKHNAAQAGSLVAINNLLGFAGHSLLVAATLLVFPGTALASQTHHDFTPGTVLEVAAVLLVSALVLGWIFGRRRLAAALADLSQQLLSYRQRPWSLAAALGTSVTLTLCNVFCLLLCLHALGLQLSFAAVLLVFTFGVGAGAATPTPGGLGGFEAGLAAGFVAYGLEASPSLAVALLYRLVSYWLPLAVGALAFASSQRRKLF